ncbi:hypothetical protein OAJ57_02235 [Alphaproteobacteria bacterium]|nr:hypothetical protein [Alphaproteobacteria bacterium]
MDSHYDHFKGFSSSGLSFLEKKKIWLDISNMSEDEFDAMMAYQKARQSAALKVGDEAPDFRIERLDRSKKRTGEFVKLSYLRGRPVALAFGSYT